MPNIRLDEDSNTNEPYLEFYQHLMTLENEDVAQVISISYGDDEQVSLLRPGEYCIWERLTGRVGVRRLCPGTTPFERVT